MLALLKRRRRRIFVMACVVVTLSSSLYMGFFLPNISSSNRSTDNVMMARFNSPNITPSSGVSNHFAESSSSSSSSSATSSATSSDTNIRIHHHTSTKIPRNIWFISKTNILRNKRPVQEYENIQEVINKYQSAWKTIRAAAAATPNTMNASTAAAAAAAAATAAAGGVVHFLDDEQCQELLQQLDEQEDTTLLQAYLKEEGWVNSNNSRKRQQQLRERRYKNDNMKHNKKVELCRLAALYLHGGYYFDLEVKVIQPLLIIDGGDDHDHDYDHDNHDHQHTAISFCAVQSMDPTSTAFFSPSFLAASPGHPILRENIHTMMEYYFGNSSSSSSSSPSSNDNNNNNNNNNSNSSNKNESYRESCQEMMGSCTLSTAWNRTLPLLLSSSSSDQHEHANNVNHDHSINHHHHHQQQQYLILQEIHLHERGKRYHYDYPNMTERGVSDECHWAIHDPIRKQLYFYTTFHCKEDPFAEEPIRIIHMADHNNDKNNNSQHDASPPPNPNPPHGPIPHILWFTYKHDILQTKQPRHFYNNIMKTIAAYSEEWNQSMNDTKNNETSTIVNFLVDDNCTTLLQQVDHQQQQQEQQHTTTTTTLTHIFWNETRGDLKADLCRVAALYLYGGYYFDLDLEVIQPIRLDPAVSFVTARNKNMMGMFFQAFLAATPGHPVLRENFHTMIQFYRETRDFQAPCQGLMGPCTLLRAWRRMAYYRGTNLILEEGPLENIHYSHNVTRRGRGIICNWVVDDPEKEQVYFYSRIVGSQNCRK